MREIKTGGCFRLILAIPALLTAYFVGPWWIANPEPLFQQKFMPYLGMPWVHIFVRLLLMLLMLGVWIITIKLVERLFDVRID